MSFIITGDIHGTLDIAKLIQYFEFRKDEYTKEDYLIICGDVGLSPKDNETKDILCTLPVTVLFIDGNHENFELLNSYPVENWNGGKVHFIEDDIIHLMRGQVYNIDGTKFFTFGGADSIDKNKRIEGINWFPEELPTRSEYIEGWRNLEKVDFYVDYIVSHTGPLEVVSAMGYVELSEDELELRKYLQRIADNTDYNAWYFGHFHEDTEVDDMFYCLYNNIIEI